MATLGEEDIVIHVTDQNAVGTSTDVVDDSEEEAAVRKPLTPERKVSVGDSDREANMASTRLVKGVARECTHTFRSQHTE